MKKIIQELKNNSITKIKTNYITQDLFIEHEDFEKSKGKTLKYEHNNRELFLKGEIYGIKIFLDPSLMVSDKHIYNIDGEILYNF